MLNKSLTPISEQFVELVKSTPSRFVQFRASVWIPESVILGKSAKVICVNLFPAAALATSTTLSVTSGQEDMQRNARFLVLLKIRHIISSVTSIYREKDEY